MSDPDNRNDVNMMRDPGRCDDFCCCKDEIAAILKELGDDACPVEIRLVSGSECCKIKGIICDVIKNNCILVLIDCCKNAKCFIPVDKIAAICKFCGEPKPPINNPMD